MTTRTVGAGHGWKWIVQGVNVGRANPRAVYGATAIVAMLALLPSIAQAILQVSMGFDMRGQLMLAAAMALISVPFYALLIGGVLRVIDDVECGRDARPTDIFRVFSAAPGGLIAFGLLMLLMYVVGAALLGTLFGEGMMTWWVEVMTLSEAAAQAPVSAPPPVIPEPPSGAGILMFLGVVFGIGCVSIYAIGLGEVALGGKTPLSAFGEGVRGALRNVLPIAVAATISIAATVVLALLFVLVAAVLNAIASLVHPALSALLLLPLYLVLLLVVYIVMFGTTYAMWRDVCGPQDDTSTDGPTPGTGGSGDNSRIEL